MRIVSLLSSATEIVSLLGLEASLVGISHECDHPPGVLDRPRVSRVRFDPAALDSAGVDAAVRAAMERFGSVYEVDAEMLASLRPDLVLTQAVCEVCAVPTGSVREAVQPLPDPPRVLSLDAHSVEEIIASVRDVADAAGEPSRGATAVAALEGRLGAIESRLVGRPRPRVLLLEWLDPPFLPGHWVPEMVERAGGQCIAGEPRERSRQVDWDAVARLDPDVLLVEPCGYGLQGSLDDGTRYRERLQQTAPRAIEEGRAWALDSAFFSRSGPRVIDGIAALAAVLHPEMFPRSWTRGVASSWR